MKKAIHILTIIIIVLFITLGIWFPTRTNLGIAMNEFFMYQKNPLPSSDKIVIVKVDNKSLNALQKTDIRVLNLTKTVFSTLIEKLDTLGARAIGMDIIFTNKSEDESTLSNTLSRHKNVVIGAHIASSEDSEEVVPNDIFSGATWGMVNIQRQSKLASRLVPSRLYSGSIIESMSIALYRKYLSDSTLPGQSNRGFYTINPLKKIPLDNGLLLIPFFHLPEGYPSYSLIDVLENKNIPPGAFSGKIVLVGEYGTLIHDAYLSPIDPNNPMPGVEFHANMLDSFLTGRFLEEKNTLVFATILIIISCFLFYNIPIIWHIVYILGLISILFAWCRDTFTNYGWIYDFYLLILSLGVSFLVTIVYRHFVTNREKRFIENAFSHYISPDVVKKISKNPKALKLGGEEREITVMFSDIAGFTTLSEQLGTEKIFTLISEYLSEMTDILTSHGGTLDKYIGDAVMGFFGAPVRMTDGHLRACATALEMQSRLDELMQKWINEGIPEFHTRIGIHTGEAMVGNIGSRNRFNYTVMGDTVNLASRLEGVNKEYNTLICVSQNVYEYSHKRYDFRELDTIRVKGKNKGIKIYELLGPKGSKNNVHDTYEKGLSFYYKGLYEEAIGILKPISKIDNPTKIIINRCNELIKTHTKLENGIWTMNTK